MLWIPLLTLIGIALIDGKLWKMLLEQRRHNKAIEQLLAEVRDRAGGRSSRGEVGLLPGDVPSRSE
jgi:hypothetical protein